MQLRSRLLTLVVYALAYLYGCVPFVDVLGRRRSVDLKEVGSGNVGATNLWAIAGFRVATVGWVLDASKGFLPVIVARRLGLSEGSAAMAGVCGTAGQCWPVTLGFSGGRGISAFIGASCAIDRRGWAITLVPFIVGSLWHVLPGIRPGVRPLTATLRAERSRSVPLGSFAGVLTFPTTLYLLRRGPVVPALLLSLVIILRRLTAPLPDDVVEGPAEEGHALVYRLLYDRNTAA